MINPRLLSVPVFAKTTLTTAVSARNGTGASLLYTVPTAAYDFAPPPAFSATSGWVVENATRSARAQGLRINRISAIAQGTSAEGVLLVFHGTDLIDQIKIDAITVTATTLSAQAVLAYAEGLLLPPAAEIRVGVTAISAAITVSLEGQIG